MKSRLRQKLDAIRRQSDPKAFLIADAKDADMAWGLASPGSPHPPAAARNWRSMPEFREQIREMVHDGVIDILLASVSQLSLLAHGERLFDDSEVTPAFRANDSSDIWCVRGSDYRAGESLPFASCELREAMHGRGGDPSLAAAVDLALYSVTFNHRLEADHASLAAFREFRLRAAEAGLNYFLEVFAPNLPDRVPAAELPHFINDHICRMLAGVPVDGWPVFLKIPFLDPAAMEELAGYDPQHLVVGILGGSSGTTFDAFKLIAEAQRHGARAALFGRKIKDAEHPIEFVRHLRHITNGDLAPEEAVKSYHGELRQRGIPPRRELAEDLRLTANELSYAR